MAEVYHAADIAIRLSVVLFMVGNLLAIGLETDVTAALAPLRDLRFLFTVIAVDWLFGPALAIAIVRALPMAEPYAVGLLLISLAPAAPFLPMMVRKAGGDLAYTAAFMLVAAVGTVVLMPLGVPLIVPGLSVDIWAVARPLLLLLLLPMAAGMTVRGAHRATADRVLRLVRPVAGAATVILLLAIGVRYFQGFLGAVGSYAIAGQLLYVVGLTLGSYYLAAGMTPARRSVVSLGACTRNLGAALAPLLVADPDPRTMVMVALGVPLTLGVTWLAAGWFGRADAARHRQAAP
jgi:predicted Na+-dependent transporter